MKKSTIYSVTYIIIGCLLWTNVGYQFGKYSNHPKEKQNAPIAIDLPEEWKAISRDSNHPEHMDVFFDRDTLRLQFVPKEEQNQRQGEYQLQLEPEGVYIYDHASDSVRNVGFVKWDGKMKAKGIDSVILNDNL